MRAMAAMLRTRYSFTTQFLPGSALFATRARALEDANPETASEAVVTEHRAFVIGAIIQCAAALEAEIAEVIQHGPGHQLGSNGIDHSAHALLEPVGDVLEGNAPLRQYEVVLHLLNKPAFDRGASPYQQASLLVKLRNELIHYKSKWGPDMDSEKLFASLERLNFEKPPFESRSTNFFPNRCFSASLASWSVISASGLIDGFYSRLGMPSTLEPYRSRMAVPPVRTIGTASTRLLRTRRARPPRA